MGWKLGKYRTLNEFMSERKEVSRWVVSIIFLLGMFAGATLATAFYIGLAVLIP